MTFNVDEELPVSFQFQERLPIGVHQGKIEIVGDDPLAIDDTRYFTIEVRPAWKILAIHPTDVNPVNLVELIDPTTHRELGISTCKCTAIEQSQLSKVNFSDYQAVFFLDPKPIAEAVWVDLRKYVESGGGLGIFLGRNAVGQGGPDSSFLSDNAQQILTGPLVRRWDRRGRQDVFISLENTSHPVFELFREQETDVPWARHWIYVHWEIKPDGRAESLPTQTLLRYGNGMPALINRQIGAGQVFAMTTPITEGASQRKPWNELFGPDDWPTPALIYQMSQVAVQSSSQRLNLGIGEPARIANDLKEYADSYLVFSPDTVDRPPRIESENGFVKFRFTNTPGAYRLKGNRGGPIVRGFCANMAASETELERVDVDTIDLVLGAENYQIARERDEIQQNQGTSRSGQEFYPILLLMLLVILAVEQLLSNRFYSS